MDTADGPCHSISVVVPVYRGGNTLPGLIAELEEFTTPRRTPEGIGFVVAEVLLVHDCGPDDSDQVIRRLADTYEFVRPVWLSRNFGQHAATLAGMASTASEWIATIDEDGQHDPACIPGMLATALREQAAVVYAEPTNKPPHGWLRNSTSAMARWTFTKLLSSERQPPYNSYRFMLGEIGRSVAAYAGSGIYLDVAIGWVTQRFSTHPVELRTEGDRRSGYSLRSLASHFWKLVLTSGTRPLRLVSLLGAAFASAGFAAAVVIFVARLMGAIDEVGWASLATIVLVGFGLVLFSLGLVAEYVGVAARMAMGKPPFLIVGDAEQGPLGRRPDSAP
jgi:undecaprenyl-phosphate 4-deoxy-4-formamido-L-arabinose transferase